MKRVAVALALLWSGLACAQSSISANEARNHVGENATVCGEVASAHYAARSRGNPTFINLDRPYPNQVFTVVIWGNDRPKFGDPEANYSGKRICVTGRITMYRGAPETVVHNPSQIASK
jgi:DNA/RNA endonuclease YhcR with UshA esterase domain